MTSTNDSPISRRRLIKAAGLGVAGTALGAVTLPAAAAKKWKWDETADVVVVGSGGSAFGGAVGAVDNGASVVVLEKGPITGGTTARSGAGMWIPNNRHMQAAGLSDDRDTFLRYCARLSFPENYNVNSPTYGMSDRHFKVLEAFYDNAGRVNKQLNDTGALPTPGLWRTWEGKFVEDYHSHIPEHGHVSGRLVYTAVFGNNKGQTAYSEEAYGLGTDMIRYMQTYVEKHGGQVLVEHRVVKIVKDDNGRVIGVQADTPEGLKSFRARKGVIFGSGGFAHNPELRTQFLRNPIKGGCAAPTSTGDLIYMASEVGVKFGNLNEAWNNQVIIDEFLKSSSVAHALFFPGGDSMIIVNRLGKRIEDEKQGYPERSRSHGVYDPYLGDYPNLYQIMIFDEAARKFGGNWIPKPGTTIPPEMIVADSLEELAGKVDEKFASFADRIGEYKLDESFLDNLRETINAFNGYAKTGRDPEFRRGEVPSDRSFNRVGYDRGFPNSYMAPIADTGPYYALLLACGALDTKGGPMSNEHGQVIGIHDEPIPGFYVAGNCSASPSGKSYLAGGATLGLGVTFGYLAGEHAAKS